MANNMTVEVVRKPHLAEKVVIVEGQAGCGKTMLSPIISALDRVELLTYAYQLEHICSLHFLGKIDQVTATAMARMLTDLQIYNTMMGRETNFRFGDLSSAFRDRPWRYLRRLYKKGDEEAVRRVRGEKPILHLTMHNFLEISEPVFAGLGDRVVMIEVVRHPLYMVKQQALNMERLLDDVRHFTICFRHRGRDIPYWTLGWEDLFIRSNPVEKTIYSIKYLSDRSERAKTELRAKYNAQIITVPFERYVLDPWPFMKQIEEMLGTKSSSYTLKMMKKQNVPRKKVAEGTGLKIYKRCGWEPARAGASEKDELAARRKFAADRASVGAVKVLDDISGEYESRYLSGVNF